MVKTVFVVPMVLTVDGLSRSFKECLFLIPLIPTSYHPNGYMVIHQLHGNFSSVDYQVAVTVSASVNYSLGLFLVVTIAF